MKSHRRQYDTRQVEESALSVICEEVRILAREVSSLSC